MNGRHTRGLLLLSLVSFFPVPGEAEDVSPAALIQAGHWKQARAQLEARVASEPNDAQAAYLLSRVRLALGDVENALKLAEKAAALDSRNADYQYQLAQVHGRMAQKAGMFRAMSLARSCRKEAEAVLALDPKHLDARYFLLEYHLQAPGIAGGDKKKGRALAEELLRLNSQRGNMAMARLALDEKDMAQVEGYYLKALEANPRAYPTQITLVNFYLSPSQKKYDLAEKYARQALEIDPGRGTAYSALAWIFAQQQRWEELDKILVEVGKNVPDNLTPYYQAGAVLHSEGKDLSRAERYFRKYLTQPVEGNAPIHSRAHRMLALTLEKQNRKTEAIAELQIAVRMEPDFEAAKKDLKRLK